MDHVEGKGIGNECDSENFDGYATVPKNVNCM